MTITIKKEKYMETVQCFLMNLSLLQKNRFIPPTLHKKQKKMATAMIERATKLGASMKILVREFNKLVTELNGQMKGCVYPRMVNGSAHNFMRNEIVVYEFFINQLLRGGVIDTALGKELFQEAAFIWDDIAHVAQKTTLEEYITLVQRGNQFLPRALQFPVPHIEDFPKVPEALDRAIVAPHIKRVKYAPPGSRK